MTLLPLPRPVAAIWRLLAVAGLAWMFGPAWATDAASLRQACNAPGHATVLQADAHAAAGTPLAAAVWLDATRLQWPGAPGDGRYRLLHAPSGGIVATPGAPARGAALALPLQAPAGPLPVDLQLRHRHLGDGVRLALAHAIAQVAVAQLQEIGRAHV